MSSQNASPLLPGGWQTQDLQKGQNEITEGVRKEDTGILPGTKGVGESTEQSRQIINDTVE